MQTQRNVMLGLVMVLMAAACGSHKKVERASTDLPYHIDEALLADVPLDQKQPVLDAENAINRARAERTKAIHDREAALHEYSVATLASQHAALEVRKAEEDYKQAQASKDLGSVEMSMTALKGPRAMLKAENRHVEWMAQQQRANDGRVHATEQSIKVAHATYELEKARLAQMLNKRPMKNATVADFERQVDSMKRKADEAQQGADHAQAVASKLEADYKIMKAQAEALGARNVSSR